MKISFNIEIDDKNTIVLDETDARKLYITLDNLFGKQKNLYNPLEYPVNRKYGGIPEVSQTICSDGTSNLLNTSFGENT